VLAVVIVVQADSSLESFFGGESRSTVEIGDDAEDKIARDLVVVRFRVALAAPAKPRRRSRFFHGLLFFAGIDCQRGSAR
jgi:hypothetical protein